MDVYLLFMEISDQYGTDKVIGVYESVELAKENEPMDKRSFVKKFVLNAKPDRNWI